ncbi:contact-dependent growth inhibition system immunity protein [Paractinoplanes ovalisporus]|uniref:contact-dependent growth inhibition system immunity protein n=1 Tax=Paractinoplanes ovalisporus TaxID=2810368 RepID=UPI0027DC2144|nr:contact-dependent growth inhibition system immunity protein [Actinoplanes ovalisporus]
MQGLDRSLQEIEDDDWGDPQPDATRLVSTVLALRRRAVGTLEVEDLRILLGQQVGVPVLVPLALARLEEDPLVEGDFYPGDLLATVLRLPAEHWRSHPDQVERVRRVVAAISPDDLDRDLMRDISAFRSTTH